MIKDVLSEIYAYVKSNLVICLVAFYAIAMVIPLLPFSVPLYYLMLMGLMAYNVKQHGIVINKWIVIFYIAASCSIMIGHPPAVFKSWDRLGLFVVVTGAVFSLFSSPKGNVFHFKLLSTTLWLFVVVGVISFFCYLAGINYARQFGVNFAYLNIVGIFGGITNNSMILGPLSCFASIFICVKLIFHDYEKKYKVFLGIILGLCILSIVVSASRAALISCIIGIIGAFYVKYKGELSKFIGKICAICFALLVCYPLYSGYANGILEKQRLNESSGGTFASRDEKWHNRLAEFEKSPFFGIGFASISLDTAEGAAESTRTEGVIEPGSTWLAVLSMTGIAGAIPIYVLVFGTLFRLFALAKRFESYNFTVLFALLTAIVTHQFAEGYAFAGGSYLCFFFWLLLGVCVIFANEKSEIADLEFEL